MSFFGLIDENKGTSYIFKAVLFHFISGLYKSALKKIQAADFNRTSSTHSSTATKTLQPLKWVQATGVAQGDFYQSGFVQMKKTET